MAEILIKHWCLYNKCGLFRDSLRTVYFSYPAVEGPERMDKLVCNRARGRLIKTAHGETENYITHNSSVNQACPMHMNDKSYILFLPYVQSCCQFYKFLLHFTPP